MLQHTWNRADQLTHPKQKVTVIAQNHFREVLSQSKNRSAGQVIGQPHNCDTAAGIFLPLTYIRAKNPHATAVLFPSDHFVFPETRFMDTVEKAIQATTIFEDRIMLLGVRPTSLELEYGWIEPGGLLGWSGGLCVRRVHAFLEKPNASQGLAALAKGALWNTLIMAAKVETLWRLGWQCMPEVMERFEQLEKAIGTSQEGPMLREIYQDMPRRNFSSDLLGCVPESIGVIELKDVLWSDWGRPERIADTLRAIGKTPAFSSERVTEPRGALGEKQLTEVL
jgi:mannose-1-phosphate guanylyltransferase